MSRLIDNLLIFGRILRRAGIDVHPGRLLDVIEALGHVNLGARDEVYHTCRALLVHRRDQIAVFDLAFAAFWRQHLEKEPRRGSRSDESRAHPVAIEEVLAPDDLTAASGADETDAPAADRALKTWSDRAVLARKDFAAFTPGEMAEAGAALSRLVWNPGERRTRRWVRGRGPRIDLRRAIGDSLRTGGDVVKLGRRTRRVRPRALVLLCDVSGSMERYSRVLLHFAHAVTRRHQRVEAFLFSTQLTRITRQLRMPRPDDALAAVSRSVPDWSGGTRIGGAVKEFHLRWGRRVLNGGPVVLLISDGWDRGDPAELRDQIARLQRSCHRLVWLNPLIGTADYAPLTRGLQAALPFVDDFLPARTLTNLADLAVHLNALDASRPARARHDQPTSDRRRKAAMEISGSYIFNAPPDRVWDLLMDPAVISSCIPGCDKFEPDGEDRYNVTLTVGLAAITGTYNGTVVLTEKIPHASYRLVVEGEGRPGFVKGSSAIALRAEGVTTAVDVSGTVQAGGPIARVGQRLIGSVARMMLDRFFACLQAKLDHRT